MINTSLVSLDILENLGISAISSVVGIGIVFIVLALIIGSVLLLNYVLNKLEDNKSNEQAKASENVVEEVSTPEQSQSVVVENVPDEDQKRIIAAITAALMVSAFDKPNVRFIVRKIRKV